MENNLTMDMLDLGGIDPPEDAVIEEQEETTDINKVDNEIKDATDDTISQESVGGSTEETLNEELDSTTESPANDNVFTTVATFLNEQGLISVQDDKQLKDINTDEDFAELMRKQIKENEYSDLSETQIKYLEALREGIPEQDITSNLQASNAYEQLTDEVITSNTGVQKDLIVQGLLAKGFDEEHALKYYKRVSDSNESAEEAIMFRNQLKQLSEQQYQETLNKTKKKKEDEENAVKKQVEDLKESIYKRDKIFEDVVVTKGMQDNVYSLMTKTVGYTEDGKPINALMKHRLDHPVEFETNLYYAYEITNGFKDMKKLVNKATTKAVNTFKSKLQKTNFINMSQSNPETTIDPDTPEIVDID